MPVEHDKKGNIIFLARAPGQVADQGQASGAVAYRGAASGNSKFDPKTGRFAGGARKVSESKIVDQNPLTTTRSGLPQGVDAEEWNRRLDTVRDASRAGVNDQDNATTFLKGRVNDLSKVDVRQFIVDVRASLLDDLVDSFQSQYKGSPRGQIKVAASGSMLKTKVSSLDAGEYASLALRLRAKGWTEKDLKKNLISKVKDPQIKSSLEQIYGETNLADWPDESAAENMDDSADDIKPTQSGLKLDDATSQFFKDIASNLPAPVVTVTPQITVEAPKPMRKIVHHDPVTKRITHVEEVPLDD